MKLSREHHMKTSKALVFDIKRFAVHDGYGLRTTIFFKGCPLRCQWCQNPEGLLSKRQPLYFKNNCIHCQRCQQVSDQEIIYKDQRPYFNQDYQGDYDHVIKACPANAIRYDSEYYDVEGLLKKIKDDQVFYRDNGGVTFSGGEPLMQGDFLVDILKRTKEEGIHTAIETSFYAPLEMIKKVLPYLDLIYVDLKIFDEKKHKEYTGVSSKLIKDNIRYLLTSEYKDKVIIRTPLIPTKTADIKNIQDIAHYIVNLDENVRYELLNYNPLASSKYDLVDFNYGIDQKYKMYTTKQMQDYYEIVKQTGIKNLMIE